MLKKNCADKYINSVEDNQIERYTHNEADVAACQDVVEKRKMILKSTTLIRHIKKLTMEDFCISFSYIKQNWGLKQLKFCVVTGLWK